MGCRLPTTALLVLPSSSPSSIAAAAAPWKWKRWKRWSGTRRPCLLLHPLPAASSTASASSSSSYNGWGELAAAPDVSSFPLSNGLILLLLLPASASALALSRLPPLPLLVAAFTAGFAARHLSSPQAAASTPRRLTLVLADLDAQLRDLRETSQSQPLVDAVDRLRDAVLEATRLANHNTTNSSLGDLADSFAAWAWDTMRDLLTSTRNNKPPKDPAVHPSSKVVSSNSQTDAAAQAQLDPPVHAGTRAHSLQDMLPFDDDGDEAHGPEDVGTTNLEDGPLERLLLKHRQNHHFRGASSRFATDSSFLHKRKLEIRDRSYSLKIESESQVSEAQERLDDLFSAGLDPDIAATDSDCEEFSRNVKEAAEVLKKARECMMARANEETADALLYKSARLLSAAVALRPTSLVAVGQLGNTYLLHGELKLKISRELRMLLANTDALLNGRERVPRSRKVDRRILSRDNISTALVDVCEECESLLVEAGRSYRTALSIDSGDVKALYNWGLVLIFRAQLLADIGPEAAVDADQVYLAAIDKFDAMLSKSNTYAPEALYRWGTALQQRSHLRPRNNKEKIRLLEQAKSLFEDVLYVEADNKMVREALSSCISELNYHGRWI